MSSSSSSGGEGNLGAVLRRFLNLIQDARVISICTTEGAELLTEARLVLTPEDAHTISSLAPSFSTSIDQSSRLGLGGSQYAITWAANSVVLQTKVESLIVSILMDEHANLGIVEEHVGALRAILKPFCAFESS